jgi:hypothetical protein
MANKKISQLTAKGARLAATDLIEISESDGAGGYVTKSVTGTNITGGQLIADYDNTLGTTITGITLGLSDSFLLPAGTFNANCQFELQWFPIRLAGTGTSIQGLVYINSTNSLTGAILLATSNSNTAVSPSGTRCTRNVNVRSNTATLAFSSSTSASDFGQLTYGTLTFNNSADIYFLFAMNNIGGVTLQSRNEGYRLIGYNL